VRFLPGDSSRGDLSSSLHLSQSSNRAEAEKSAGNEPAGGCTPIGSSPGLIHRNIDQRGSQDNNDGAHQTIVQESQGNKNAHSPTRE